MWYLPKECETNVGLRPAVITQSLTKANAAMLPDQSEDLAWLDLIGTVGSHRDGHTSFGYTVVTAVGVTHSVFIMLFVYFV